MNHWSGTAARLNILVWLLSNYVAGQSLITGAIAGTVTDPSSAIVSGALVTLVSSDSGEVQSTKTNTEGLYRFAQLKPGAYQISVKCDGFATEARTAIVNVGQIATLNFALEISRGPDTVEVEALAPLINTDPGVVTNFSPTEVSLLPAAGGDMTTVAFTAPGVVVAPGSGYGNFTVNGLPGTSNLFTVNGENSVDPYFNVSGAGASNLMLGINEVQEVAVITNPYSGQYGQLSGAQVTYVTKSGTNSFHGNAQWWWNGRAMNSNNFFSNATQVPRPFANANQWAASMGGPIIKNHIWFFVDTEGLRFVLPNVNTETIPTPDFASAVLTNIQNLQPNELPAFQSMFKVYADASVGKVLTPVPVSPGDECSTIALPAWTSGSTCANHIVTTPVSFDKEWVLAGRIDQQLSMRDDLFFRFKLDHGLQPSWIDPLNYAFDANSSQPAWDYQLSWRHGFASDKFNSFIASVSHYVAQFVQNESAWKAVFPYGAVYPSFPGGFSAINAAAPSFPQGRNITQYQFIDDFSWTRGRHTVRFGANFRRYDISDHNFLNLNPYTVFADLTSPTLGPNGMTGMQAYANGAALAYSQQDIVSTDVPVAVWGLGIYLEDQWKVTANITLTGVLRLEKNANPVCNRNCFSNFKTAFPDLASVSSPSPADVPYSNDINPTLHDAYRGVDPINIAPRLAFSWAPGPSRYFPYFPGRSKTVVNGGVGIFYDNPAAVMVDNLLANPPNAVSFYISPIDENYQTTGILPFDSSAPNGGPMAFAAASTAFNLNKSYKQLSTALSPIIGYTPPLSITSIQGTIHSPQVQEWNLKVDEAISNSVALSIGYNGNHMIHIPYSNDWWNAFATNSIFVSVPGINSQPVPNYGYVKTVQSGAVSNYNGLTTSVRISYHNRIMAHMNYTYSHGLDETSNGGLVPIGGWPGGANVQTQINPGSLRKNNYGNQDYDIRNLFNADYVVSPPVHFEKRFLRAALDGWQWSGKVYVRSGLPYSVSDGNAAGGLSQGGFAIAQVVSPGASEACGGAAAYTNTSIKPCLNPSAFVYTSVPGFSYSKFPTQARNQFRGPHYVNSDMGLFKTFQAGDKLNLGLGATAFNVFNHPNFNLPDSGLGDATFGQILSMQGVPASPYGNFLGFDSSVRVVQLSLKLTF